MKPFNLQDALNGKPVITGDGKKVLELHLFNSNLTHPLVAVIEGEDVQCAYTKEGTHIRYHCPSKTLLMKSEKKTLFLAIDKNKSKGGIYYTTNAYSSLKLLKEKMEENSMDLSCWELQKIEIEE